MPRAGTDNANIVYPPGCREVSEDLGPDELIRRLKTLAHTFQSMGQDEGAYQEYVPLALHLADDYFLLHQSRDVQLLIACCIADVLRVYAPEAPYKHHDQVKTIFLFLIKQLSGLKDPKDPAFKRYFYLLENLAYVKSFNMCFELDDCQEIFCALFSLMFKIVNDEHSGKVKSFMLDVLCPLITESDIVSNELLDIILMNIVEPNKSQRKNAYLLAKELVVKCSDTLEPYIQAFFNHVLILGKEEKKLSISRKVYDLIYELNHICPSVLLAVLPQLEFKLKSTDENERMGSVSLLARMFSEKDSTLAIHHRQLWQAFLGRFNDISVMIRTKCVQYSMHFLLNHPELRRDITETLKLRQHDGEENVRYEVVMAIVTTAKRDFSVVSDSEDLLNFVKERTLDKKFKIRKEAMCGLAMIYRKHLSNPDVPEATKKAVMWIKDKILHGYYMTGMDDRLLVERLLNTCLVPYQLPAEERMKKLYYLLGTIDDNANKAFIELQKHQLAVRKNVAELVELHRRPHDEERDKDMAVRVNLLSKFLPEPVKAQEFIKKFSHNLTQDEVLLRHMETVVNPDVSCKDCAESVAHILKKLGQPVMTNLYYNTVKMLLERVSSVMVDKEALKVLVGYVEECLKGGSLTEEIGLNPETAGERGLRLLFVLSFVFPSHFLHEDILTHLLSFLAMEDDMVAPLVLSTLTFVGKYKPIGDAFSEISQLLIPICQKFAEAGTPKQAKQAIRCLFVNTTHSQDAVFTDILERLKENLSWDSSHYRTAIVSLGHIAYNLPDKFPIQVKNLVSRKLVKELLMKETANVRSVVEADWCEEEELPEETRCKMEGMKMMARWLLGLKSDNISAQKTFRMLNAFIVHKGELVAEGKLSKAEKAWMRLSAGCCMLKICEQKGVGDQFTAEQFYNLSLLMMDESAEVRERFSVKLHKGLSRGIPHKCLPLDFMGFYALSGQEQDKRIKNMVRQYMVADISKRREYIKSLILAGGSEKAQDQLPHIMPDYMLVFAVPILAHDPEFVVFDDVDQLFRIRTCLWFVLEPLMKSDTYCFGFYKALIERMKNHRDSMRADDDAVNFKLWAVCDLAMGLIMSKTTNFEMKEFPSEPRIPPMYFKRHDDGMFVNSRTYLPAELQYAPPKKLGITIAVVGVDKPVAKKGAAAKGRQRTQSSEGIDRPPEASDTKISLPGMEESEVSADHVETMESVTADVQQVARDPLEINSLETHNEQSSKGETDPLETSENDAAQVTHEKAGGKTQQTNVQKEVVSRISAKPASEEINQDNDSNGGGGPGRKRTRAVETKDSAPQKKLRGAGEENEEEESKQEGGTAAKMKTRVVNKITSYFPKKNSTSEESETKPKTGENKQADGEHLTDDSESRTETSENDTEAQQITKPANAPAPKEGRGRGRLPKGSATVNKTEVEKNPPTKTGTRRGGTQVTSNGTEKKEAPKEEAKKDTGERKRRKEEPEEKKKSSKDDQPPSPARKSARLASTQDDDTSIGPRRGTRSNK